MKKLFFAIISLLAMIVIMTSTATAQNRRREPGRDYVNDAARRSMGILRGDQRGVHRDNSILGYHVHERRERAVYCQYYGCDAEFFCEEELFNHMYRHGGDGWSGVTASLAKSFLGFLIKRSQIQSEERRAKAQIKLWREILKEEREERSTTTSTPTPINSATDQATPRPQGKGIEIFIDPEQFKHLSDKGAIASGAEMKIFAADGTTILKEVQSLGSSFTYYPLSAGPSKPVFTLILSGDGLETVAVPLFPKLIDGRFRLITLDKK